MAFSMKKSMQCSCGNVLNEVLTAPEDATVFYCTNCGRLMLVPLEKHEPSLSYTPVLIQENDVISHEDDPSADVMQKPEPEQMVLDTKTHNCHNPPKYDGQINCRKCGTRHPIGQPCQCDAGTGDPDANKNAEPETVSGPTKIPECAVKGIHCVDGYVYTEHENGSVAWVQCPLGRTEP